MLLKLMDKKDESSGTKSFFFEPEKPVDYLPGQFFYFTLPKMNYTDPRGNTRHFTLSSSPSEGNILRFTTRMRIESGYKKTLDELPIGTEFEGQGPNGTFFFDEKTNGNHVLLTGGIGITPFRSMIKYSIDKKLDVAIQLLYSNSKTEEITFRDEFENWGKSNENIHVYMTVSKPEESSEKWNGPTGRIDENVVREQIEGLDNPTFWVCGPPSMVTAMEEILSKMNVPEEKIQSEKFSGY